MNRVFFLAAVFAIFNIQYSVCHAQSEETADIQQVIDACIALRDAVGDGDSVAAAQAATMLDTQNIVLFSSLRHTSEAEEESTDGHLVFGNPSGRVRGQTPDGSILTKTVCIDGGKSSTYRFRASGHQELAIVAETGGLVTMKVHVTNSAGLDQRYDDTKDVHRGRPQRKVSFELPESPRCSVEVEIINCSTKKSSFVVISN